VIEFIIRSVLADYKSVRVRLRFLSPCLTPRLPALTGSAASWAKSCRGVPYERVQSRARLFISLATSNRCLWAWCRRWAWSVVSAVSLRLARQTVG